MKALPTITRVMQAGPLSVWSKPDRPERVTIEVGRGDALILATAHADGKLRLAFGTGEEFVGYCRDLPVKVGDAARNLLDVATSFTGRLPRKTPEELNGGGNVRFALRTAHDTFAGESRVTDLEQELSPIAPLWRAFSDLLGPLTVVLFGTLSLPDRARRDIPGLARAQRLWVESSPGAK